VIVYPRIGFYFIKGATAWEFQWGRLYLRHPFRKFREVGFNTQWWWLNKDGTFPED